MIAYYLNLYTKELCKENKDNKTYQKLLVGGYFFS